MEKETINLIIANAILNGYTQLLIEIGILNPRDFSIDSSKVIELNQVKILLEERKDGT